MPSGLQLRRLCSAGQVEPIGWGLRSLGCADIGNTERLATVCHVVRCITFVTRVIRDGLVNPENFTQDQLLPERSWEELSSGYAEFLVNCHWRRRVQFRRWHVSVCPPGAAHRTALGT